MPVSREELERSRQDMVRRATAAVGSLAYRMSDDEVMGICQQALAAVRAEEQGRRDRAAERAEADAERPAGRVDQGSAVARLLAMVGN